MKILTTCTWYYPQIKGGAETMIKYFCNSIVKNHEVKVYCRNLHPQDSSEVIDGVNVKRQKYLKPRIRFLKRFSEIYQDMNNAKRIDFDFDICGSSSIGYALALKKRYPDKKIIFIVTALSNKLIDSTERRVGFLERLARHFDYFFFRYVEKKLFLAVDEIVVPSKSTYDDLMRGYPSIDSSKIRVVYRGINIPELPKINRQDILKKLKLPLDKFILLDVSRLDKFKNTELLIKSMKYLDNSIICVIVGGGGLMDKLIELANNLGLKDRCFFTGEISEPSQYYRAADIFVHPSLRETFGMVFLEAMAFGLPVIGIKPDVNAGVVLPTEEIISEDIGIRVENDERALAEAVSKLKKDEALRKRMSVNAREKAVANFSADKWAKRVIGEEQ